ncbi:MAG: hypothetical protein ABI333_17210 [bacterium]
MALRNRGTAHGLAQSRVADTVRRGSAVLHELGLRFARCGGRRVTVAVLPGVRRGGCASSLAGDAGRQG